MVASHGCPLSFCCIVTSLLLALRNTKVDDLAKSPFSQTPN